jgi:SAM-dependent methyltransferase
MDNRDHPPPCRSSAPTARLTAPACFEWTRRPGIGPGVALLLPLAGAKVVELGCGSGRNLAHLVAQCGSVGIGIDHDPAKIGRARGGYGHLPGMHFVLTDARTYLKATAPGSVDLVLSIFGAFSFTDPLPLLTDVARVLRPGGQLAITLRADDRHDTVVVLRRR